jgi:molecular chaperone GrpE
VSVSAEDEQNKAGSDAGRLRVVDRRWWAQDSADVTGEDVAARKPTYVEEIERQLAEKAEQLQTFITDHRRALDEFEQVKLRIRRDIGREVERGKRVVLAEMLEVIDNLDRAICAARDPSAPASGDALLRGVELVRTQFLNALAGFGVARIPALGESFDAARHEAVTTTPVQDPALDATVIHVVKEGYAVGDELLRPASVVVGRSAS